MNTTSPLFEQPNHNHTMMANTATAPPAHVANNNNEHDDANHNHHHHQDNDKDETESTASMSSLSWDGEGSTGSISQQARNVVRTAEQEHINPWWQRSMVVARHRPSFPSSAWPFHNNKQYNNTVVITKATKYTSPPTLNKCSPMNRPPWMMTENMPFLSSKAVLKRPAITIQAAVRGMMQRLRYRQLLIVTKFSPAATIIQAAMRAKLQRIRFRIFCQELLEEYHATNIQKWFRGTHLRRRIERHYSALVIQDKVREWLKTCI